MVSSKNPEEYFPGLHIHILKIQAERWIKKFPEAPIKRILLYNVSSPFEKEMGDIFGKSFKPYPHIYAIVFEVDAENKALKMTPDEQMKHDLQVKRGKHPQESYERLLEATEPNSRSPYEERYRTFITQGFKRVYKSSPKNIDPYRKEWQFIVKFKTTNPLNSGLSANIKTDEPHIILSLTLKGLITEAAPEVESLFKVIKRVGFSGRNPDANDETWQKVALQHFDKNQKQFNIVKREYLEDKGLYAFVAGQEARDFKGPLHQKIIEGKGLGKHSARNLADLHKQILSEK